MLITADRVWDGRSPELIDDGFVAFGDGVITAVGRQSDLGSGYDGDEALDLPGATVLPGLINAHVHLTLSATPDPVATYLEEARRGLPTLTLRAVTNLEAAARVGVTTVRDLGTPNEVAFTVRDAAAVGTILSPRILTSGEPITITGGHCHWFSHQCDSVPEIRRAARHQLSAGADLIKIFATGGNLTPRTNPFAPQFSIEDLQACVEEARRVGAPVAAHAHAPEGIRRAVAAGVSTIEHCLFETADGVDYDHRVAARMAEQHIAFCPTLGAGLLRALDDPSIASPALTRILAKFDAIASNLRNLVSTGVPLLAGSDAGIPNRPFGDYPADIAALTSPHTLGLSPLSALIAATSGAAAILGLTDTGTLAPGMRADLLAVDGNPLADIDDLTRTRFVQLGRRATTATPSPTPVATRRCPRDSR